MARHLHSYSTILQWHNTPWQTPSEFAHRSFKVEAQCSCGKTKVREAEYTEIEDYVRAHSCTCGIIGDDRHVDKDDCIRGLFARVQTLEEQMEKLRRAF